MLDAREVERALALFHAAEAAGFDADECSGGRWFCRMLAGDFEQAWHESDCIALRGAPDPNRLWSGHALDGKNVVIRCLHGLGDAIQFIRFAQPLRARAQQVFAEVPGSLVRLFQTLPYVDGVFTWDDPRSAQPNWDEHIEVMELGRYFRATPETLPADVPYLFPSDGLDLGKRDTKRVNVGVAWESSAWNPRRCVPINELIPVLSMPECRFFSLQQGNRQEELRDIHPDFRPRTVISTSDDVLRTASLVKQLDLVIAVDTMVAHLAGALGKPVWLLLEKRADWRWMMDRADSPWYPTMHIFRQRQTGNWTDVVGNVALALERFAARLLVSERKPSTGDVIAHRQSDEDKEPDDTAGDDYFNELRLEQSVHKDRGDDGSLQSGDGNSDHHREYAKINKPNQAGDQG
jgi:hypothetical protein